MKLFYPGTDIPFIPSPSYFLGELDIYDREETLGEYLNQFDPNDRSSIQRILKELFFDGPRVSSLTSQHKAVLAKTLAEALQDYSYDFKELLEPDWDAGDTFSLPFDWDIKNPRMFFEEAYRLAQIIWRNELEHESISLPVVVN